MSVGIEEDIRTPFQNQLDITFDPLLAFGGRQSRVLVHESNDVVHGKRFRILHGFQKLPDGVLNHTYTDLL